MNAEVTLIRNRNDLRAVKQCLRLNKINERLDRLNEAANQVIDDIKNYHINQPAEKKSG